MIWLANRCAAKDTRRVNPKSSVEIPFVAMIYCVNSSGMVGTAVSKWAASSAGSRGAVGVGVCGLLVRLGGGGGRRGRYTIKYNIFCIIVLYR